MQLLCSCLYPQTVSRRVNWWWSEFLKWFLNNETKLHANPADYTVYAIQCMLYTRYVHDSERSEKNSPRGLCDCSTVIVVQSLYWKRWPEWELPVDSFWRRKWMKYNRTRFNHELTWIRSSDGAMDLYEKKMNGFGWLYKTVLFVIDFRTDALCT